MVEVTEKSKMKNNVPPYATFPVLKGTHIYLRQIEKSDLNDILEISFYDAIQAENVEVAAEMQSKIDEDYQHGNTIHWGIIENNSNKIAGTCGYYRGFENHEGELGCVLLPKFQGKGYMSQAMQLAIEFGFQEMKLNRIWAATRMDNAAAIKLLERLGFIKVRELPDNEVEYELLKK